MSVNLDLVARLENNPKSCYVEGVGIYLRLLNNIIDNPNEEKYRRFKRTNQKISRELLSLDGMNQLIFDSGFELDNEEFVLRRGGLGVVNKLKSYRDFFQKRLEMIKQGKATSSVTSAAVKETKGAIQKTTQSIPIKILADKPFHDRIRFPQILQTNNNFLRQLEQLSDSVMQYEDKLLQQSAIKLMPVEKFKLNALEKLRKLQKMIESKVIDEEEPPLDDLILEELAAWFKNDFFKWVNSMPCRKCKNEGTDAIGTRTENGVRIEVS
jgi:hypothetical protein